MSDLVVSPYLDEAALALVSHGLDLRAPNEEAVRAIVDKLGDHERSGREETLEVVIHSAVGVGKTYVMAATIDYYAIAEGTRNFVIIAPGRVILEKTIANFTSGHAKSLADGMDSEIIVVTAENFDTARKRVEFSDPNKVKVFVFTVQSLLTPRPGSTTQKRTHSYQEGLGRGLYEHLQGLEDLIVFADEHHAYFKAAFSKAVRDLHPRLLVGLTGTPHKKSEELLIYRYPLAWAISDGYVKIPVLVGRNDDRKDIETQLADGVILLDEKQKALDAYCAIQGLEPVNAVMLVLCQKIEDARTVADLLRSDIAGGTLRDQVLEIHSDKTGEEAQEDLAALAAVDSPGSNVRVIVAVDKLKEGWDVKSVYVVASLRASVSQILTEQTLGRGLRLPFGSRTGSEFLDTLEVLAHDRYEDLLKARNILKSQFISYRSAPVLVLDRNGVPQLVQQVTEVETEIEIANGGAALSTGRPALASLGARVEAGQQAALAIQLAPRDPFPVPIVRVRRTEEAWSLAKITDLRPYRELGESIAADPEAQLRRTVVTAKIRQTDQGLEAAVAMRPAADRIAGTQPVLPLDEARSQVRDIVLRSDLVPARPQERAHVERLLDALSVPLGDRVAEFLSAFPGRTAERIVGLLQDSYKLYRSKPNFDFEVTLTEPFKVRVGKDNPSDNRHGEFKVGQAYTGWNKSMYDQDWFQSRPERSVANVLDTSDQIRRWVRLQTGDLPITWTGLGSNYNPDFIAEDISGDFWIIEVKADRDLETESVRGKADAAREAVNHFNGDPIVLSEWHYLLVGESDILDAKDSWTALRKLGR